VCQKKGNILPSDPTGGQHFNGQAEWMIGILKKQMPRSLKGKRYSHEEMHLPAIGTTDSKQ
jgi:hypothetical protein